MNESVSIANAIAQTGLTGVFAYLTYWFTQKGFPAMLEKMSDVFSMVLNQFDKIEDKCAAERQRMYEARDAEREKDRVARHEQGNSFQRALAEQSAAFNKAVSELAVALAKKEPPK